jgi:hypothetical protein
MVRMKTIGALAALSLALACGGRGSGDGTNGTGEEELVLRSYAAPGRAHELEEPIRRLLLLKERQVGTVQVGPGDQLLVLAPRSVHEGLAELIANQADAGGATAPSSVLMTYWFVAAQPAARKVQRAEELKEIQPVLDEIEDAQGPQDFRLIEGVRLRQAEGNGGGATTPKVEIRQRISVSDGNVVAWIRADPVGPNLIDTTVNLRAGQFLVLGQLGLDRRLDPFVRPAASPRGLGIHPEDARPTDTALYLIVRAEVDQLS